MESGTSQFLSDLPPKRDCGTKRVNMELHTIYTACVDLRLHRRHSSMSVLPVLVLAQQSKKAA